MKYTLIPIIIEGLIIIVNKGTVVYNPEAISPEELEEYLS